MAIVRWDPFSEMMSMQRDFDRIFGRMGMGRSATGDGESWMPRVDVRSEGEDMVVYAELPGMKREDIDIEVTEGVLTIKGERNEETEKSEEGWLVRERSYGSFERSLMLPQGVDAEKISADYKDGVLEVHVPKGAEALKPKTRHVALTAGGK